MPRVSREAIARDREQSRLRAIAYRKRNPDAARIKDAKYRIEHREHINEQRRLRYGADMESLAARPFIGWDGEGYTDENGNHHYMLFGCSYYPDGPIIGNGIATKTILEYILFVERHNPTAYHVGFAFDYDVNMILADLPSRFLRHLKDYSVCHWEGYRIQYVPGKFFRVSRGRDDEKVSVTIFDTFGFFHSKYTTSLLKFGVATKEELAHILEGKEERPNFTFDDIEYVKGYWQDEISWMPPLMDKIRDACYDAGLYVTQWHGPGALASYMLRKRGTKQWKSKDVPAEVQIAIQAAYAGGRFQPWRCGLLYAPVYTADINSAYIYACSLLPSLSTGRWVRATHVDREHIARFAIYRIRFNAGTENTRDNHRRGAFEEIFPLFHRDGNDQVSWPFRAEGWYWSPEASLVKDDIHAEFLEAWIYHDDNSYPFGWVDTEFNKRLELQHEGNPAEKTFKWALAAMYGAFAQRVGWDRKNRKPPPKHELAWAGFITSWCRAEMYKVACECWRRGGLISIDTDSVISTVPIKLEWLKRGIGEKLGQWKVEEYSGILYWQTGFYWLLDENGEWSTAKTRGVKRGSLDVRHAFWAIEDHELGYFKHPVIGKESVRFVGFREALNRGSMKKARQWIPFTQEVVMGGGSTYRHFPPFCIKCRSPQVDMMHVLTHFPPSTVESKPHDLPWLKEQPGLHPNRIEVDEIWLDTDLEDNL